MELWGRLLWNYETGYYGIMRPVIMELFSNLANQKTAIIEMFNNNATVNFWFSVHSYF